MFKLSEMAKFEDELDRLASAGQSRRQSTVGFPMKFSSCHSVLSQMHGSVENRDDAERWERKAAYRVLVMGATMVGKTSIITHFLYDQVKTEYEATVEEMYRVKFNFGNTEICLNIEDTSGNFSCEFPAMLEVSLCAADAVLLVFSVQDSESFEEVALLRDRVRKIRGQAFPIVVVGNKTDLDRVVDKIETEALVTCDWENGYVECSAKDNEDVNIVFKEVLDQIKMKLFSNIQKSLSSSSSQSMKRRQSFPAVSAFKRGDSRRGKEHPDKGVLRRRSIGKLCGEDSCNIC